jgi:hypothetical protein
MKCQQDIPLPPSQVNSTAVKGGLKLLQTINIIRCTYKAMDAEVKVIAGSLSTYRFDDWFVMAHCSPLRIEDWYKSGREVCLFQVAVAH